MEETGVPSESHRLNPSQWFNRKKVKTPFIGIDEVRLQYVRIYVEGRVSLAFSFIEISTSRPTMYLLIDVCTVMDSAQLRHVVKIDCQRLGRCSHCSSSLHAVVIS